MRNRVGELHIAVEANNLAWLAGLLEGEGCFSNNGRSPTIYLKMTDRDIVERVAHLVGGNRVGEHRSTNPKHKDIFYTQITGPSARSIMRQILPYMGARRTEKIVQVLRLWDERE